MIDAPSESTVRAWTTLVRASQQVLARVESDLKAAGFPPLAWYDALLELERADGGALRPGDLEARMLLAQYNVSRLVARLARAGYVAKRPCRADRRGTELAITVEGRVLLRRMWPAYAAAIERHLGSRLNEGEAEGLAELLARLVPGGPR